MLSTFRFPFLSIVVHTPRFDFYRRRMSSSATRTYKDAIDTLNTLQTNAAVLEAVRAAGAKLNPNAISEMVDYLRRVGLEVLLLPILLSFLWRSVTAISIKRFKCHTHHRDQREGLHERLYRFGLKGGKASLEDRFALLHRHMISSLTSNAGLYTSPHLVAVRERIRINGEPLSEEDFTRYFFEVWDLLQKNTKVCGLRLFPVVVIHNKFDIFCSAKLLLPPLCQITSDSSRSWLFILLVNSR